MFGIAGEGGNLAFGPFHGGEGTGPGVTPPTGDQPQL